jgi:hypothetical protein
LKSVPNEINHDLLFNDPQKFVVKNQYAVEIIVDRYVKLGYIHIKNKNEVIQHINLRLLDGVISKMQAQYDPSYFVSTYFATIVNNLCKEFLNLNKKNDANIRFEDFAKQKESKSNPNNLLIIDEEIKRLEFIFGMYNKKKVKLLTALKIKLRLDIKGEDLAQLDNSDAIPLLHSNAVLADMTESALFEYFAPYFDKSSGKQISGNTLKRWTYQKIEEIIYLLNENTQSTYNLETLGTLYEKYLENKSNSSGNFYI